MMSNNTEDPRLAGAVQRWHAVQTIRTQNVAEHSWNVLRILYAIYPEPPRAMVVEAMFHDIGEIATGDPPSTLKRRSDPLKTIYRTMESAARLAMALPWGVPPPQMMTDEEMRILKLADMIEMMEFAQQEVLLGNRFMHHVMILCREWIVTHVDLLANDTVRDRAENYLARRLMWLSDIPGVNRDWGTDQPDAENVANNQGSM
jgi:hypothetical protein